MTDRHATVDAASIRTTLFAAKSFGYVLRSDTDPACAVLVERGQLARGEEAIRYDAMECRDVVRRRYNYVTPNH